MLALLKQVLSVRGRARGRPLTAFSYWQTLQQPKAHNFLKLTGYF